MFKERDHKIANCGAVLAEQVHLGRWLLSRQDVGVLAMLYGQSRKVRMKTWSGEIHPPYPCAVVFRWYYETVRDCRRTDQYYVPASHPAGLPGFFKHPPISKAKAKPLCPRFL